MANILMNIGAAYSLQGNNKKRIEYYLKALQVQKH